MKIRIVLEGVGAALLLLLPYYRHFLYPSRFIFYYHPLPVTNLVGGLLVDLLGLSILTTGFLVATEYLPPTIHRILLASFAGLAICGLIEIAYRFLPALNHLIDHWKAVRWQCMIAIPLLSGTLAYFRPRITQPVERALRFALAAFAFSALWIVPELLYFTLVRQPDASAATVNHPAQLHSNSKQRIIWILFDELSYDQTFDHPAPGIQLPNFDRLRAESFLFSNLKPAGFATNRVIPSLFLGQSINQIRSTIDGELWYKDEYQNRWLAYDPNATLFGLAQRNGWSTGVDGWTNPYCRILAPVVDTCYWVPGISLPMEQYGASEEKSALANAVALPNQLLAVLTPWAKTLTDGHLETYRNVMAHTQLLIDDDRIRFVFLHLNVPHPPGIYDRQRHMLRSGGNYLDNLVLSDDTLGALYKEIYASPSASQTTLIISSDHSWRIPLWRNGEGWSDEEERASGGRFDVRPVLLIHFPGQKSGNDVNASLPELLEHDIIAGMLRGQINNPEDLAAFLAQRSR
jgi:hypothetical protein